MRREARLDNEAPESRGHRVEAAVEALAVAAIAEKRCCDEDIYLRFASQVPEPAPTARRRRRRDRRSGATFADPRRHVVDASPPPDSALRVVRARRKRRGSNDKSAFGLDFREHNLMISPFFAQGAEKKCRDRDSPPAVGFALVSVE
jgi:hypothetical protein